MKTFFVLVSLLLLLPVGVHAQEKQTSVADMPHIIVNGMGEVKVKPDIARLTLGVETTDKDNVRASELNAGKVNAVVRVLSALGVARDDIQTTGYTIEPKYSENDKETRLIGYTVRNSLVVTVRKIAEAGRVMDGAIKAGANVSDGVTFDLNAVDKAKAEEEALINAMHDGERKAKVIAKTIHVTSWYLYRVLEEIGTVDPLDRMRNVAYMNSTRASKEPTPINSGDLTIRATVTLQYNYMPIWLSQPSSDSK